MSSIGGVGPINQLRITGMATGMDTDETVKKMTLAEQIRVDKAMQDRQVLQWRQEAYREITGSLNEYKNKYFDVLSSDYILLGNKFSQFDISTGDTSNAVNISATASAKAGEYKVKVNKLAGKATFDTEKQINIMKTKELNFPVIINANNEELDIDGHKINIEQKTYTDLSSLASQINSKLEDNLLNNSYQAVVKSEGNSEYIQIYNKIRIDDTNKELNIEVDIDGSGTIDDQTEKFSISVNEGYYTMEQLASEINIKLQDARSSDGTTSFPDNITAETTDGLSIIFKDEDDAIIANSSTKYDSNNTEVTTVKTSVSSTSGADGSTPVSIEDTIRYNKDIINGVNDTLNIVIDGDVHTITIPAGNYTKVDNTIDMETLRDTINAQLSAEIVNGTSLYTDDSNYQLKVDISNDGNNLMFVSSTDDYITMNGNAYSTLGITNNSSLNMTTNNDMSNIFNDTNTNSGKVEFTINGHTFKYDFYSEEDSGDYIGASDKSINTIIREIESEADVDINYSELTREFTISSKEAGTTAYIEAQDSEGSFIQTLFGNNIPNTTGSNGEVEITDPSGAVNTVYKDSNNFTIDGIKYTLNNETASEITFNVTKNIDDSFDKIKEAIEGYNDIIDKINKQLTQKYNRNYSPLSDEQKSSMSDDEIERWEEKAKEGLLYRDTDLSNMLMQLRKCWTSTVEDAGISFGKYGIGIDTSSEISDGGKIKIVDEDKLKDALRDNPEEVTNLFVKKSSQVPIYSRTLNSTDRGTRFNEEGVFQRISDVLNDYVGLYRDSNGKKGALLEKAGIENDSTFIQNTLSDRIKEQTERIKNLNRRLYDRQDHYYNVFARLETMMNEMNAQSNWLYSQLG